MLGECAFSEQKGLFLLKALCLVVQKDIFRYLGSVVQKDGDIDEDVRYRISAS